MEEGEKEKRVREGESARKSSGKAERLFVIDKLSLCSGNPPINALAQHTH